MDKVYRDRVEQLISDLGDNAFTLKNFIEDDLFKSQDVYDAEEAIYQMMNIRDKLSNILKEE